MFSGSQYRYPKRGRDIWIYYYAVVTSVIFVNENEKIENENAKIAKLVTQRKCQHTIRRSIRCADVM